MRFKGIIKCIFPFCILILIVILIFVPKNFTLKEYEDEISNNAANEVLHVDQIKNKPKAYWAAKEITDQRYSTLGFSVYSISYDAHDDCWFIQRTVWSTYLGLSVGGRANVFIQSDGTVLSVWIER